jgi:hypothetical protein
MSNASIIQDMREACDRYEAGEITEMMLAGQIEGMVSAFERLPPRVIEEGRELAFQVALATEEESEVRNERTRMRVRQYGLEAMAAIRCWLDELARRSFAS